MTSDEFHRNAVRKSKCYNKNFSLDKFLDRIKELDEPNFLNSVRGQKFVNLLLKNENSVFLEPHLDMFMHYFEGVLWCHKFKEFRRELPDRKASNKADLFLRDSVQG